MDTRARLALEELARQAVHADMDALHVEISQLRHEMRALRVAAGLPSTRQERRDRVAELRAQGFSTSAIAQTLDVHRVTVERDLGVLGAPAPATVTGIDGRQIRMRPRPLP